MNNIESVTVSFTYKVNMTTRYTSYSGIASHKHLIYLRLHKAHI